MNIFADDEDGFSVFDISALLINEFDNSCSLTTSISFPAEKEPSLKSY